jgi:hypothetical protein
VRKNETRSRENKNEREQQRIRRDERENEGELKITSGKNRQDIRNISYIILFLNFIYQNDGH